MAQDFFGRHCLWPHKNSASVLSWDLPQCSGNFQDCRKSLHKVAYLHQFHSLLTRNCPSQRRGRPEKSPSPVVQRKAAFREILFQLLKTPVLHYSSSSWARPWLLPAHHFVWSSRVQQGAVFMCWPCSLVQKLGWMWWVSKHGDCSEMP